MAIDERLVCDQCGGVLQGKNGTEQVERDFLQVKGKLVAAVWNHEFKRHIFTKLNLDYAPEAVFCNADCLKDFFEWKKKEEYPKLKERLIRKGEIQRS